VLSGSVMIHAVGQRMTTQLAEHDGYFACNILSLVNSAHSKMRAYYFGGLWEETMMMQLSHCSQILHNPPIGWNVADYTEWRCGSFKSILILMFRDTFGVGITGKSLWNDRDFGATSGISWFGFFHFHCDLIFRSLRRT
jgi:hypothetical protein